MFGDGYLERRTCEQRVENESRYRELKHCSSSASAGKTRNPSQRLPNKLGRRRGWEEPGERSQELPTCNSIFGIRPIPGDGESGEALGGGK
jgi:hypothetical protein